jgi:hypothetical protein
MPTEDALHVSDLLAKLETYIRTMPRAEVRVVVSEESLGDQVPIKVDAEASLGSRDLVEDGGICAVEVGEPRKGMFTCFLDGMQRPRGPIYINSPVPIVYGYVSAVIRTRGSDRRMRTLPGFHEVDEALYFAKTIAERYGVTIDGVRIVDTSEDCALEHPLALLQAAKDKISTVRGSLESAVAARWVAENSGGDEWLLVDGSLQSDYGEHSNIVGVTKSHSTQYLTWEEQRLVLSLKVGERSGVFVPVVNGRRRPVYSWYLRMQQSEGRDVYFGLVRVEAPRSVRSLEMVDELSRWLLAERSPLSLPDMRWDKMLYPIRDCEQYMKSLAPTHTNLDARLMRLGMLG